ncbi:MAG: hypothetical protein ABI460_14790 [Caldimonas sp.]
MDTSEDLLAQLDAAVAARDSPAQAVLRVGRPPWIDSGEASGLNALRMTDFAPDTRAAQDFTHPHGADRVLYWGMPGGIGVNVAGLLWDLEGRSTRFRATVLAP